jgi:hypothetical protein
VAARHISPSFFTSSVVFSACNPSERLVKYRTRHGCSAPVGAQGAAKGRTGPILVKPWSNTCQILVGRLGGKAGTVPDALTHSTLPSNRHILRPHTSC